MALVLLTGGARSGKSRVAVELARRRDRPVVYIATAEPGDAEMVERIRLHQAERPPGWRTIEAPLDIEGAMTSAPADALIVIDCLSIWIANLMGCELPDDAIAQRADAAAKIAAARPAGAVAVTNEVGAGVVPPTPLGRRYRDVLGRANAQWAAAAERVGLVVAGRLLPLSTPDAVWSEDPGWLST